MAEALFFCRFSRPSPRPFASSPQNSLSLGAGSDSWHFRSWGTFLPSPARLSSQAGQARPGQARPFIYQPLSSQLRESRKQPAG